MFLIQNIIALIYPSLILDVLNIYWRFNEEWGPTPFFYLKEFQLFRREDNNLIVTSMSILLAFVTLMIIFNKGWEIEYKFGYFCFISIYINMYAFRVLVILVPFTLLILVRFLKEEDEILDFIRNNKFVVIAMLSIIGLSMMPNFNFTFYKYAPFLENYPYYILLNFRWIFFISVLGISMIILHLKYITSPNNEI